MGRKKKKENQLLQTVFFTPFYEKIPFLFFPVLLEFSETCASLPSPSLVLLFPLLFSRWDHRNFFFRLGKKKNVREDSKFFFFCPFAVSFLLSRRFLFVGDVKGGGGGGMGGRGEGEKTFRNDNLSLLFYTLSKLSEKYGN